MADVLPLTELDQPGSICACCETINPEYFRLLVFVGWDPLSQITWLPVSAPFFSIEWAALSPRYSRHQLKWLPRFVWVLCGDLLHQLKQPCWKLMALFSLGICWSVGSNNLFGNAVFTHPLYCSHWELHSRTVPIRPSWICPLFLTGRICQLTRIQCLYKVGSFLYFN